MIVIRQVTTQEMPLLRGLCDLLIDIVHNGASVGFLSPLSQTAAERYWMRVYESLGAGLALWVAEQEGEVVGTVQLALCEKENGRHRADVQKLLVLSANRGQGIASRLLADLECVARTDGRTLLVLDTEVGSSAEAVYRHLGWQRVGEIPNYATNPAGKLHGTAYYFKLLKPLPSSTRVYE